MVVEIIILEIYVASTLIPLGVYFFTRKYQPASMGYLAGMLLLSFLVDSFGLLNYLWFHLGKKVNAINNFYGFFEIAAVIMVYQSQISPGKKRPFFVIAGILILIQLSEMFIFRGLTEFSGISRSATAITVTALALLYFFKLMRDLPAIHLYYLPMFWINIGMLLYFTGNFFVFVMKNYLIDLMNSDLHFHQIFHNFLGILTYIIFAIGFWQVRRQQEEKIAVG